MRHGSQTAGLACLRRTDRLRRRPYKSFLSFCSSSHFTILPTSWARSRGQMSRRRAYRRQSGVHANHRSAFSGRRDEITAGVEGVAWSDEDVAVRRVLVQEQPVHGSQERYRSSPLRRESQDARRALRAGAAQARRSPRDIFEFRVDGAQLALVVTRSDGFSKLFQCGVRLWQKTFQILKERGYPQKNIPRSVIVSGSNVFLRKLQFGLLVNRRTAKTGKPFVPIGSPVLSM